MIDDYVLHLETRDTKLVADSSATRPGTQAKLQGAFNELTVASSGNAQDDRALHLNEVEAVTTTTLLAYASGILNKGGIGLNMVDTPSLKMIGTGITASPIEMITALPVATEDSTGIVKVVHEGSHGYPCPGISDRTVAGVYNIADRYMLIFRNGADDLEKDVFLSYFYMDTKRYVPTSERFRPPGLPITAKPLNVVHSGQGTILINTTDGLFVLLTDNNTDWATWRAVKLEFPTAQYKPPLGYDGGETWRGWFSFVIGSTLYLSCSKLSNSSCFTVLWTAPITAATTWQMTFRPLTGINANGTAQTGVEAFYVFDKIWGATAAEKCMAYNSDGYWADYNTAHHGDDIDFVIEGNKVRVCHDGLNYFSRIGSAKSHRHNISYVIDVVTKVVSFDDPGLHPMPFTEDGWAHAPHPPLMRFWGGNDEFSPVRSNGMAMAFASDNLSSTPGYGWVENNSGISDFENIKSGRNQYNHYASGGFIGNYGGVVTMGFGGLHAIADNTYLGRNSSGTYIELEVDPYGAYGPTISGYGPTNNRKVVDGTYFLERKAMVSTYDGEKTSLQGVVLTDTRLSGNSLVSVNGADGLTYIAAAPFNEFKEFLVDRYASDLEVLDSRLTLMIHRTPNVLQIGMLQIMFMNPSGNGEKLIDVFLFSFTSDRKVGMISTLTLNADLHTVRLANNVTGMQSYDNWYDSPTHGVYRLDDGTYVITMAGTYLSVVGNSFSVQYFVIWDPATKQCLKIATTGIYNYLRRGWCFSKEFGFGFGEQSAAGESFYLRSYGKNAADIIATVDGTRQAVTYTMVMSRTDAGDNVTVSQLGATNIRDKITSLIPPARKVQNMDLSADRTITKAMLANADLIPNQRDSTYPVQQVHRDTLSAKVLSGHTHPAGDFTMNMATAAAYGKAQLGNMASPVDVAADVLLVGVLSNQAANLWHRGYTVTNKDPTIQVDVEI